MARGFALILLQPCLALAQPLPEAYRHAAEHFRVPPELLWAVTQTESGANLNGRDPPWPWTLNIKGTGYRYASREQACLALLAAITVLLAAPPPHATASWSATICNRPYRHEPLRAGGAAAPTCGVLQHRHRQLWRINLPNTSPAADAHAMAGPPDGQCPDAAGPAARLANRALPP